MSRLLGIRELFLSTAVVALLGASACGDDDDPAGPAAPGGSAGSSGRGGAAGSSGAAGSGVTGGAAGSGATAGASGSAGTAGSGGAGGGGATDGGGAGGSSGSDAGDAGGSGGSAGSDAGDGGGSGGVGGAELDMLKTLAPLPAVPADTTNRVADSAQAAALGQKLFFDQHFSGPLVADSDLGTAGQAGKVSCASCHSSEQMDDARSMPDNVSMGANRHSRNSPALVNASFYKWTNWGGRFAAQWELPLVVLESPVIMNGNRLQLAHRIFDVYKSEYETVFATTLEPELANTTRFPAQGKPGVAAFDGMPDPDKLIVNTILVNYSKAIAAYMRLLVSRDAPFDNWIASNATNTAISEPAVRGALLFIGKARCMNCHSGPHFSDGEFHNIGVPQTGPNVPASDDGRFKDAPPLIASLFNVEGAFSDDTNTDRLTGLTNPMPESTKSAFRTPGLRGVALTAPYMHSGQLATLEAVVDFYNVGGGTPASGTKDAQMLGLGLTSQEKADLVEFLKALTGAPVPPALLVDSTP